jgi:quercetin dioxygenase-like cupin family protein
MSHYKIDFAAAPWIKSAEGARYKVHKQGGKQLRMVEFAKNFKEVDWCRRGHIGCVLDGEMEIDFNGTIVTFVKGDGIFIPPGEKNKHKAKVLTNKVLLMMVEDI